MSENAVKTKKKKPMSPFHSMFLKEIKPKVEPLEAERKKYVNLAVGAGIFLAILGCVYNFIYCKYLSPNHYNLNIMALAYLPAFLSVLIVGRIYKDKIKNIVLPLILSYAGDFKIAPKPTLKNAASRLNSYASSVTKNDDDDSTVQKSYETCINFNEKSDDFFAMMEYFFKLNIFQTFNFAYIKEHIQGNYKGIDLNIYETQLWDIQLPGNSKTSINSNKNFNFSKKYNGIVINFKCPKTITTQTMVLKDKSVPHQVEKGVQKINLEDPEFEKYYDVYSSDQIESRTLLTPAFMNRMVTLCNEKSEIGINMSVSFMNGYVNIAVAYKKSLFDVPLLKPVTKFENYRKILKEFNTILSIIDTLKYTK